MQKSPVVFNLCTSCIGMLICLHRGSIFIKLAQHFIRFGTLGGPFMEERNEKHFFCRGLEKRERESACHVLRVLGSVLTPVLLCLVLPCLVSCCAALCFCTGRRMRSSDFVLSKDPPVNTYPWKCMQVARGRTPQNKFP